MGTFIAFDARYHDCRVVATRLDDTSVDVHLDVATAERFVAEQAFEGGDGWVQGTLARPLEIRFAYGSASEARAEATLLDHWGRTGAVLEVTQSVETQGIVVVEPATGLFTGMRLGRSHLDEVESDPADALG